MPHSEEAVQQQAPRATAMETFQLGPFVVPRIFSGLWQLSSPAWGTAATSKILRQFQRHVDAGFTAFDMADHYGDAELLFGRFRSKHPDPSSIVCATKYCVFHKTVVTEETMCAAVEERLQNLKADKLDLLQFHWQHYDDAQYIQACKLLEKDERVTVLGLCNFDTVRMQEILESGVKVATNQVHFSLIDARPTFAMGKVCMEHDVKLLTYGTLCGGFLADKWLGKPEPNTFNGTMTPSHRKYLEMINTWGGWELFQTLLETLSVVARKHSVSISNVATRWILDFPYVGAVIVGSRMGVSDNTADNLATFGWSLDEEDKALVESVLKKSRRDDIFTDMGDCGSEYR